MSEHNFRTAILKELEISIQEISPDFKHIPPQKSLSIDNEHHVVDLLFYIRNMQCLMPVNLKFGEIQIDDIELMKQILLTFVKFKVSAEDTNPIGIILCVTDNEEHVELVKLEQTKGFISKNLIEFPLKQIFKTRLHDAVLAARRQLVHGEVPRGHNER